MSTKDLKKLTASLRAEGIDFEVRDGRKHFQIFVGGRLVATRSHGGKSSQRGRGSSEAMDRSLIRRLKQEGAGSRDRAASKSD